MIITVAAPGSPETAQEYALRVVKGKSTDCQICQDRQPVWFADPASNAAMEPDSTVLKAAEICGRDMNTAIRMGTIEVTEIDIESF